MEQGWIKLHRKLLENPIIRKPSYLALWVVLLLKANHKDNKMIWNGNIIVVKEGQMITGRKSLSEETNIPESTIEDILKFLETQHQIQQQKTTKFRLITIVNWKDHQSPDIKSNNKATTKQQQADTNNNDNNTKKDKNTETSSVEVVSIIDEFKKWNPSAKNWYKNTTQRKACEDLVESYGLGQVLRVIPLLPKTNARPYLPTITTALQLFEKYTVLQSGLERMKTEKTLSKNKVAF